MVQPCSAKTGEGIWEGMNQIADYFDAQKVRDDARMAQSLPSLRYENS